MDTPVEHFHDTVQRLARCLGVDPLPAPPALQAGDRIRITHCSDRTLPLRGVWTVETIDDDLVLLFGTLAALSHRRFGDRWELVPHDTPQVVS